MSTADLIFIENCKQILNSGLNDFNQDVRPRWHDGTPAHTLRAFAMVNRYDLSKEFPAVTLRRLSFKNCVDEILWIWQKKSNQTSQLQSRIWDAWADDSGSIGKAYGYQLGVKHQYPEGDMDQVDRVLYLLKHDRASRRIITNIYNHQDLHAMGLYPCAYSMTFVVTDNKLNAILNQRSQDFLTANNWNVAQYSVLTHIFAQASGLDAGEFVHVIADAHIYDRHIPIVESLIKRVPRQAPKLWINPNVKNFYEFTADDFKLEDYKPHPSKDLHIEVAV